jgi:hypothetical protein
MTLDGWRSSGKLDGTRRLEHLKARLEESFPDAWTLTDGLVAGGWQTVIEIRSRASKRTMQDPASSSPLADSFSH